MMSRLLAKQWQLNDVSFLKTMSTEGMEKSEVEVLEGLIALRDGEDYVNTDGRYERAYQKLTSAFKAYVKSREENHYLLSKLYLWRGIALNENKDIDFVSRNKRAIQLYKNGLKHLQAIPECRHECLLMKMVLDNSTGVAFHHKRGQDPLAEIPAISLQYYGKVLHMYLQLKRKDQHAKMIMDTVERNSGFEVRRPEVPPRHHDGGASVKQGVSRNIV
jgi:hypothetical protein